MDELSIVLGLIIFIVLLIVYNKTRVSEPCNKYATYFDKIYYDLPLVNAIEETNMAGLNDMSNDSYRNKVNNPYHDLMKTRWIGSSDTQPTKDDMGRRQYTNIDKLTNIVDLHHCLKNSQNSYKNNKHKFGYSKYLPQVEKFSDDEWIDPNFSYNEKYQYDRENNNHTNNSVLRFVDTKFNTPA